MHSAPPSQVRRKERVLSQSALRQFRTERSHEGRRLEMVHGLKYCGSNTCFKVMQRLPLSLSVWSCSVHALTLLDPLQSRIVSRDANAARNMLACACLPHRPPWLMSHDSCPSGGDQQVGEGRPPAGPCRQTRGSGPEARELPPRLPTRRDTEEDCTFYGVVLRQT